MRKAGIAVLVLILYSTFAFAQNNRSAVSLSGSDVASCTVPDPCRTFDVAISRTNAGGEVIVLSSAGYGPFSVTKSISIIAPTAVLAAIAPIGNSNAITIDADNAVVVVRGLTLNGSLGALLQGIFFTGQTATASNTTLYVDNCVIRGFVHGGGITFGRNGTLSVNEVIVSQNNSGIVVIGNPGFPSSATIDHTLMHGNLDRGLRALEAASVAVRNSVAAENFVGFEASTGAFLSADHCQATGNSTGFIASSSSGNPVLTVSNCVASSNSVSGITAFSNGTVHASNNTVSGNGTGLRQTSTGVLFSAGNNIVHGNTADTSGTITPFGPM